MNIDASSAILFLPLKNMTLEGAIDRVGWERNAIHYAAHRRS